MPPPVYGCHTPTDSCTGSQALLLRTPYNRYRRRQGARLPSLGSALLLSPLHAAQTASPFCKETDLFFAFSKTKRNQPNQTRKKKLHVKTKPRQNHPNSRQTNERAKS